MRTDLRPSTMAEAFIKAALATSGTVVVRPRCAGKRSTVLARVLCSIERPGVGLVDNNTGRPVRLRSSK